jgi:transposase
MNKQIHTDSQVRGEQVASKKYPTIKLGLDVHADSIRVVRMIDGATPQPAQKMSPKDFLKWAAKQVPLADKVYSCYEAGPFGYGLHRQLVAMGIENVVIRPQVLDEYYTRVNTDKTDAAALTRRLDAYVRGNRKALTVVRVPTEAEEQQRIASRQREQLRREMQRVAAQGRSLLLSQGYRERGVWWRMRWLELRTRLPQWLAERLEVFRVVLQALNSQLNAATRALEEQAPPERPRGMGGLTYETVQREIGDWQRFKNRRQVGSYTGLCAGVSSSGRSTQMLSINKCGNQRLRCALVVMAWRMVIYQPRCHAVHKWRKILLNAKAGAAARKKAIVAVARQLAVDLWRWRTGRATPEQLGWIMAA